MQGGLSAETIQSDLATEIPETERYKIARSRYRAGYNDQDVVESIGPVSHQGGCDDGADHEEATNPASILTWIIGLSVFLLGLVYVGISLFTAERLTHPTNHRLSVDPREYQ